MGEAVTSYIILHTLIFSQLLKSSIKLRRTILKTKQTVVFSILTEEDYKPNPTHEVPQKCGGTQHLG